MPIPSDPVHAFVDYPDVPVENAADGPLAGLTFAVKDIFDVAGYPTGGGNPEMRAERAPAAESAPAVAALLDAGARFVGKTHTAELAFSLDGRSEHYGTPINPAAPDRVPGGSSSGSAAAVAAGLVDIAFGSDTGGSVRAPASMCGIIGLRTTHGRIDTSGVLPLAPSLDTVGWFTRSATIYDRVGEVLLGNDAEGPALKRLVIAEDAFALLSGDAEQAALRSASHAVAALFAKVDTEILAAEGLEGWREAFRNIQGYEAWQAHGPWIQSRKPNLTPPVKSRFEVSSRVTREQYHAASAMRAAIRRRVLEVVGDDGAVLLPSLPTIAPRLDGSEADFEAFRSRALSMLCIAGRSGLPQISLPLAKVNDCPLGLSVLGPPGRDRALIGLARAILPG
jgi:amidase